MRQENRQKHTAYGVMALWRYGVMALWRYGVMALWRYGVMIPLNLEYWNTKSKIKCLKNNNLHKPNTNIENPRSSPIHKLLPSTENSSNLNRSLINVFRLDPEKLLPLIFLPFLAVQPINAAAELSFNGESRFIMKDSRLTITLVNPDKATALAQVSIDWGNEARGQDLPMAVSAPLVRIPAKQNATVEVFYQGQGLPDDRESYFLLNVLDVPKTPEDPNALQIALRHRFKLFYRPALQSTPDEARAALTWEVQQGREGQARASNPSPYYLTLTDIEALGPDGRRCGKPIEHLMLPPFSSLPLDTPTCRPDSLHYQVISDAGNPRPYRVALAAGRKSQGSPQF